MYKMTATLIQLNRSKGNGELSIGHFAVKEKQTAIGKKLKRKQT